MSKVLIGLHGLSRSGKDTAADYLVEHCGFVKVAFAGPLKKAAAEMLGLPLVDMYEGDREKKLPLYGVSIRQVLQLMGTEFAREMLHKDFWVLRMKQELENLEKKGQGKVVITDVRFDNEAIFVRKHGGTVVVIDRPGLKRMSHASEAGIQQDVEDVVVKNGGSLRELYEQMYEVYKAVR